MHSKKVLVFAASASKTSINLTLVKWASQFLTPLEFTIVDFSNYVTDQVYVAGRQNGPIPKQVTEFRKLLDSHDGVLMSMAENNFGPTAAWKSMLDWLSRTVPGSDPNNDWKKTLGEQKPYLILGTSPSPYGAATTVENATKYFPWLGAKVVGSATLPSYYANFKDGKVTNEELADKLKAEVKKLVEALQ